MDSILNSIKKLLGIQEEYEHFDQDIIMHINSVFITLSQIGAGPPEGFSISDNTAVWNDFISDDSIVETIKIYMYLKVRLIFDPPSSSSVMESINRTISELEWRIYTSVDPSDDGKEQDG